MTIQRMIELLQIEHECMLRVAHDDCDRNCADCELVQDDGDLHEMYANVISMLKEQEPVEPNKTLDGNGNLWRDCGECGGVLPKDAQYCPTCGRKVKLDAAD